MNFQFTKKKTIVAVVVGVFWSALSYSEGSDRYPEINQPVLLLGAMIITFLLIFVIWSLFERKNSI